MATKPLNIAETWVALDAATGARPLPVTPDFWDALRSGRLGPMSRLISFFDFSADWTAWEKHPAGEEFVMLIDGAVEFVLERAGGEERVLLDQPGQFVLVPPDTWHTAKVRRRARMLFVTPGQGTGNRAI
jgi:mannose-6-phosphate isomerase-like protein (cupin superfamily)